MLTITLSPVSLEAEAIQPAARPVTIPADFVWLPAEVEKLRLVARKLNCKADVARELLVYFLRYIQENHRGLAVAQLPEILAGFPVKWGYKKKRNDFLKLLRDLEFIRVDVNYWAKIRAKTYGLGPAGRDLVERLARHLPGPLCCLDRGESDCKSYATISLSTGPLPGA